MNTGTITIVGIPVCFLSALLLRQYRARSFTDMSLAQLSHSLAVSFLAAASASRSFFTLSMAFLAALPPALLSNFACLAAACSKHRRPSHPHNTDGLQ